MSTEGEQPAQRSIESLLSGILGDVQQLVDQQIRLTRQEVETQIRLAAVAGIWLGTGMAMLLSAVILLSFSAAYWLHWLASPPDLDAASLPLWVCDAMVAAALAVVALIFVFIGRAKFNALDRAKNPPTKNSQELIDA
ncbi:MAG: phage holin family protein [Planctomycetaceae bacterium]|nr:MAG: phage holin family protein [Planctomycetaceae bacterium]